jgi:hypothetical protein
MSENLNEEEMRRALFGTTNFTPTQIHPDGAVSAARKLEESRKLIAPKKVKSPTLRVVMHVSNVYEGDYEVVTFETGTLSRIVAEMDAKKSLKKKYKYITVIEVVQI